jgi:hypothetical protein
VSVFAYCEYGAGGKTWSTGDAFITGLGPYVRSHRRHFQQQCEYTVCTVQKDNDVQYACHEAAFVRAESRQDMLWKFTIPTSERRAVLKRLNQYNINAFSLFGSEESLMETVALNEILFRENL